MEISVSLAIDPKFLAAELFSIIKFASIVISSLVIIDGVDCKMPTSIFLLCMSTWHTASGFLTLLHAIQKGLARQILEAAQLATTSSRLAPDDSLSTCCSSIALACKVRRRAGRVAAQSHTSSSGLKTVSLPPLFSITGTPSEPLTSPSSLINTIVSSFTPTSTILRGSGIMQRSISPS